MKKVILTTTFNSLRAHDACDTGYKKLGKYLGGITKYGRNKPINLLDILKSNGASDMLWSLRAIKQENAKVVRLIMADIAEEVLPLYERQHPRNKRPRKAIQAARDFANHLITSKAMAAVEKATRSAIVKARDMGTGYAAWHAARTAAHTVSERTPLDMAWATAFEAASSADEINKGKFSEKSIRRRQATIIRKYLKR